jgi:hypothetical protein
MMARRHLLLFALSVGVVLVLAIAWGLWPRTAITAENATKIQPGMTFFAVECTLSGPPRDDSTGAIAAEEDATIEDPDERHFQATMRADMFAREVWGGPFDDAQCTRVWVCDQLIIRVDFDQTSRVVRSTALPVHRTLENPLDLLRRWLRL